jgi:hypothetical protein
VFLLGDVRDLLGFDHRQYEMADTVLLDSSKFQTTTRRTILGERSALGKGGELINGSSVVPNPPNLDPSRVRSHIIGDQYDAVVETEGIHTSLRQALGADASESAPHWRALHMPRSRFTLLG